MRIQYCLAIAGLSLAACNNPVKESAPDFLAQNLDTTVSPSADFFEYANGGWIKRNAIPASESAWGIGQLVQEDIYDRLKKINEKATLEKAASRTVTQQIGDFWYSGMDSAAIRQPCNYAGGTDRGESPGTASVSTYPTRQCVGLRPNTLRKLALK